MANKSSAVNRLARHLADSLLHFHTLQFENWKKNNDNLDDRNRLKQNSYAGLLFKIQLIDGGSGSAGDNNLHEDDAA